MPKLVGINALTANILCRTHNSMLSTVDDEGICAFHAIRRFEEILSLRKPLTDATELQHEVCGSMLERWFIKHTVNLFVVSKSTNRWSGGSVPSDPPQEIVEAAFGLVNFQSPRGLYNWAGQLGERRIVGDQIGFQPIFDAGGEYLGAHFDFQALSFLIWLSEERPRFEISGTPLSEFYHHMGGKFEAPPLGANFRIHW